MDSVQWTLSTGHISDINWSHISYGTISDINLKNCEDEISEFSQI